MKTAWIQKAVQWGALVFLVGSAALPVTAADVDSVRLWRAPDHTRLVFDLSGPVDHKLFSLSSPSRVVVDVADTRLKASLDDLALEDTPIRRVRSAHRSDGTLRVVFDLKESVRPKSFLLKRHAGTNDRLVIDLHDQGKSRAETLADKTPAKTGGDRNVVIAVDAGHGGEDPGAIGPGKLYEKNVVFDIAKRLVRELNAIPGYEAKLVRTGDYYVPLRERRNIARKMQADLFVSIHADAFTHPSANGSSVFALSRSGATSETARFLAERENEADLIGGVGSVSLEDKDEVLAGVLVDLSMTATLNSSLTVGKEVLESLGGISRLHKPRVEQAGFAVLKSPDVPSILVETGFISNPGEARKLATAQYRQQMADRIGQGVRRYFERQPPAGTYLANRRQGGGDAREYTISRGDTLSAIARQHNVSVDAIRRENGLNGHVIQVGQVLKIPSS
ncbi:N-acetylmuramoyl-L-alanine amidase [Marinimicrobium sp. C6131]|uniref:N-acetylmuramoyl-L-alanine amidase n=1 Tax=Marinimicrobium sp. C6131 TaxID=3022676 RepID=UPI00223E5ECD|nr:N-acetylmuramoyl-L-alanine amidase [Marinimicrobium sp. C6131]UZJ43027.1 N-acetylmuramoyl-L-alanine amidase [Marinimicrobium sp. C6131]